MHFISATEAHYKGILNLVPSREELYLVYPSGTFPLDNSQLQQLAKTRSDLTVAIDGEHVVAFANLYQVNQSCSAFIGNVVVANSHRGQGIGKALTLHMAEVCQVKYEATPHLSVFNFNTKALLMYTGLGFKPYAIEQRENLTKEPVALVHMSLR